MAAPMAAASIGTSILGGLFSASGAAQQAESQSKLYQYQAGVSLLNAQIAKQNANYALDVGEREAYKYGLGARQQAGQIVAGQAASGLDVNTGSAKQVQESQHLVSTIDMDQIRTNAVKTAYDYETQATQYQTQAMMDLMGAKDVQRAGTINVASSFLGTASSVADKWLKGNEVGLWG